MTPSEMGRKGGLAASAKLTPEQRKARAIKASKAAQKKRKALDVVEFYAYVKALGGDPRKAIAEVYAQLPDDVGI